MNRKLTRRQVLTAAAAGAALTLCGCRQQEPEEAKPELILRYAENQQAAIMEAGADTQAFNADLSESAENKVLDELKSSGCNVVDVPDKTPWQEACQKVISENTSDQAELYQQLLDMKG